MGGVDRQPDTERDGLTASQPDWRQRPVEAESRSPPAEIAQTLSVWYQSWSGGQRGVRWWYDFVDALL